MPLSPDKIAELEEMAYQIRRLSVEMITYGRWGHIGGSFSLAELLAALYFNAMRVKPDDPHWPDRDRIILSKAHASPALYAAMALRGYFPIDALYTYCELGGILEGHTDLRRTPGLESSGGPLGMGLSVAAGMALGLRFKGDPGPRVFCILGDGETNESNVWEAAMSAAHYHLDNLITIVDYNKVMAKGFVWDLMSIEPYAEKWSAFGWDVLEVDGHDIPAIGQALHEARWVRPRGKPIVIIAHTVKGRGVHMCEFNYKWHTHAPDPKTADTMLRELACNYNRPEEGYSRLSA
ncbi:MAG: transketolase, partial [Chloroflexi bacterium]|nr:transketolase [Chloroflexota bacterium]